MLRFSRAVDPGTGRRARETPHAGRRCPSPGSERGPGRCKGQPSRHRAAPDPMRPTASCPELPKEWPMSARPSEPRDERSKTTVVTFRDKHRRGEPLALVTAYDFPTARAVDEAGVDGILVGDSLAMVVLGHPNTLSVTMDEMLHHARAVSRGAKGALLIGDLPFLSYQADEAEAVRNAGRFLAESGMDAVKLEGGRPFVSTIRAIVRAGIPVQGHIGLTPQRANALGGFKVQGRRADEAQALLDDARALEDAGCFSDRKST